MKNKKKVLKLGKIFSKIYRKRKRKIIMNDLKLKQQKKRIKKKEHGWFKRIIIVLFTLFFLATGGFLLWAASLEIPDIHEMQRIKMSQATKIYDRTGKIVLYNIYEDEKRTVVPLNKISKKIQEATVAIEDEDFYIHDGSQPWRLLGSIYHNIVDGQRLRGASTITQQVIKQTLLNSNREISRKIKEIILSFRFESIKEKELGSKKAAKDSILEMYLNENPYGGTIYGVEEASNFYFGKHASEVTLAEAAYLASMPQAPTTYSPYGKHKKALDRRKNLVLYRMWKQGYVNKNEYEDAIHEDVMFVFRKKDKGIKAPHFVMYVRKQLEKMYSSEELKTGGMKVYTTLDYELQEKIQKIVAKNIKEAEDKKLNVSNGAVVVITPGTGEILSMVGSKNYFSKDIDGKFNVATARRQPGSTFKPFAYMTAFQKGYTPKTVIWDVKTEFSDACNPDFTPKNGNIKTCYHPYDYDKKFKGHMLMEQALPESRNIPAVKTIYLAGLNDTFNNIKKMGIESLDKSVNHYGLSLVLGVGEVKLVNLVSAYGVFANKGERVKKRSILRIEDKDGNIIYETKKDNEIVLSKRVSLIMSRILSDNTLKYPTFGMNSPLYFKNRQVASKTGTTSDDKDFWVVGFDPGHIALGSWVGNNNNKPGKGHANFYAKKIWRESMEEALKEYPNEDFEKIDENYSDRKPVLRGIWQGNAIIKMDITTGGLATDDTPEEFIKEIPFPEYHSILHWVDINNPNGPIPENKDRSYGRWEYGVNNWIQKHNDEISKDLFERINELKNIKGMVDEKIENQSEDNVINVNQNISNNNIKFKILSPGNGDIFREDENIFVNLKDISDNIKKYRIYINNKYIISSSSGRVNLNLKLISNLTQENSLKIRAINTSNQYIEKELVFYIK